MTVAVALIGRDNARLYTRVSDRERDDYEVQMFIHCTLDIVEDKLSKANELYLGLLTSDNKYKSYGFVTNTGIKFILVLLLANTTVKDTDMRAHFKRLHLLYTNCLSNPFYELGKPLKSKALDDACADLFRSTPIE